MHLELTGHQAGIRARLAERRKELEQHNPQAITCAAQVLAAMADAAYQHVPSIRCDRQVRYREAQFQAEKATPIEDLAAIGLESEKGREVAIAGLRVLAAWFGQTMGPAEAIPPEIPECAARLAQAAGTFQATVVRAVSDGLLDAVEREALGTRIEVLKRTVALTEAALQEERRRG